MIKTFVSCLSEMGVSKERLVIGLRLYEDIHKEKAIGYWAGIVGIEPSRISEITVLKGRKKGKLAYGMCRLRLKRGGEYLKLLKSIINLVQSKFGPS